MKPLEDYFNDRPIQSDVDALSDPKLDFEADRTEVNELVMNLAIKYLAAYLEVAPADIAVMRGKIHRAIARRKSSQANPLIVQQYGVDMAGEGSDDFPVRCLADSRQTAAIFKEIAFADRFKANGRFVGVDWGSGTGILTLAMAIAARRQRISERLSIGVDLRERAVRHSRRVLKFALDSNETQIICSNILKSRILPDLLKKHPLHFWVSETISRTTPPIDFERRDFGFTPREIMYRDKYEASDDPFPEFLGQTMNAMPDFLGRVRRGEIAMFPDIANRLYYPHKEHSLLTLKTGLKTALRLEDVGREFKDYEDLGESWKRWRAKRS
ncbi:hypothetical protein JW752_02350 [Candidatus Peregrinibacteria bacterium]|nr:hypothetical protein [Candidatus Peregrinibacteria bacterium]